MSGTSFLDLIWLIPQYPLTFFVVPCIFIALGYPQELIKTMKPGKKLDTRGSRGYRTFVKLEVYDHWFSPFGISANRSLSISTFMSFLSLLMWINLDVTYIITCYITLRESTLVKSFDDFDAATNRTHHSPFERNLFLVVFLFHADCGAFCVFNGSVTNGAQRYGLSPFANTFPHGLPPSASYLIAFMANTGSRALSAWQHKIPWTQRGSPKKLRFRWGRNGIAFKPIGHSFMVSPPPLWMFVWSFKTRS